MHSAAKFVDRVDWRRASRRRIFGSAKQTLPKCAGDWPAKL
jgi:hypothetical protein